MTRFVMLALLLLGCGWLIQKGLGKRMPPASLSFGNTSEPQTLDPAKMTGVPEGRIARALFEGLTKPNLRDLTKPLPGAAMRWEISEDGRRYTFYLRENAQWSNGSPVTAEDFLYTWRRVLAPQTASYYAEMLWPVRHARAFNQKLFHITSQPVTLWSQPSTRSKHLHNVSKDMVVIREDEGQKEIAQFRVLLRDKVAGKPKVDAVLKVGTRVWVLKRLKHKGLYWYLVSKSGQDPSEQVSGWLREDVLVRRSREITIGDVEWLAVRRADNPSVRGWVQRRFLDSPRYAFPGTGVTKKGVKAWELLGLKVKRIQKPVPKGYSSLAVGRPLIFEVMLEAPTAYFLQLTNFYALSPVYAPIVQKYPRNWVLPEHFVGNGPFRLTHWLINDLIRVEKNQKYWDADKVRLQSIHFLAVSERDTQLSMYLAKDMDVVTQVPLPSMQALMKRKDFRSRPYLGSYFYRINVRKPPLNNKFLRQALCYAIDRKSLVKHILRGGQRHSFSLVPPGISSYEIDPSVGPRFDPVKAKALMRQAGYTKTNKPPPLSLLYNTDQQHKQVAEALQKMWREHLNLEVNLVNKEWKTYLDDLNQGNYQIARAGWIGDYTDPNTFLSMFITGGGHNRTGWSDGRYDALIERAERAMDVKKRMKLFREAEAKLLDELPIIPLYYYNYQNLIQPYIRGHIDNPLNMFEFRDLWRVEPKNR